MVSTWPAGVILRPSGRMTLPSPLRCAGRSASAEGACAVQLLLNEGPLSPQPAATSVAINNRWRGR